MDEADKILIDLLVSNGLEISDGDVETFEDFTTEILINAASFCLESIFESKNQPQSFPRSFPEGNIAGRYKVGQKLSEAIKSLGFTDTIGYQSFLYPNVKDTRRILSFLIEKLPKDSGPSISESVSSGPDKLKLTIQEAFRDGLGMPWLPHFCKNKYNFVNTNSAKTLLLALKSNKNEKNSNWFDSFPPLTTQFDNLPELISSIYSYNKKKFINHKLINTEMKGKLCLIVEDVLSKKQTITMQKPAAPVMPPEPKRRTKFISEESKKVENVEEEKLLEENESKLHEIQLSYSSIMDNYNKLIEQVEKSAKLIEKLTEENSELCQNIINHEKELEIKEKTGIVMNYGDQTMDKLKGAIEKKEMQLEKIQSQWTNHKMELEEKIQVQLLENQQKHSKTNQIVQQMQIVKNSMSDCHRDYQEKDVQINLLNMKVKQMLNDDADPSTKQSRQDFTKRIFELTENKKKQDSEINRILSSIFILQKEINGLRGKLERCFIETNDCIFVAAKRDELCKHMYKLLIGIHENCRNLVEVIEDKGRLLREIRELETNLDMENREGVAKNLKKIGEDYQQAKLRCDKMKVILKQHKNMAPQ